MKNIFFLQVTSQMGGVEFSTLYLAQHLDQTQWSPLVICPADGDLPRHCREAGIAVAYVPCPRFRSTSSRFVRHTIPNPLALLSNLLALIFGIRPLVKFLREHKPALLITKGMLAHFHGGLAARLVRVPVVWHVQDRVSERAGPLYAWMLGLAGKFLAREIIVDAESIARQLEPLVPRERIHIVWNGVDTRAFSPEVDGSRVRAEWKVGSNELLIGVVGRLTRWKGQEVLIRAFAKIADEFPKTRIVFIGAPVFENAEYENFLREECARRNLAARAIFAGFRWDMPDVFAALDVVAHTALEKDSSPLAVVSAMASGKAIVCSRVDGTAQLFDEGKEGLLYAPGDADALAEKLRAVLRDADFRKCLGQNARAKAERELSVGQFAKQCEAVFEKALG